MQRPRPNPDAGLRLICLPYSGGRAAAFKGLAAELPGDVELCAVELPGHGRRLREKPRTCLRPLVEEVTDVLIEQVRPPFVLLGYSLGALLAFEVARELARDRRPGPAALFVAASGAPHRPSTGPQIHDLPKAELVEQLVRLDSSRNAPLEHEDLVDVMLPVVRADLTAVETYVYEPGPPLDCPLVAFGGRDDPSLPRSELAAWAEQTAGDFSVILLAGGHFFLHSSQASFARVLTAELERLLDGPC
ncbi:alpha/beta fold hydrolase [Actinomadura sp. KC216]|uniref:thioesterase II family protein n=1 Tax=Actinomadura sp. KC216 TaxID=2530370 RepID=UPI001404724C|nr:alpha/beta fold hydrolase [Actinomadura sp. KC216]